MNEEREHRRGRRYELEPDERRYCSVSSSKSASSTQANTTTTNIDKRVAAGDNSTIVSADNSTVTLTDQGAVHDAFGFAQAAFDKTVQAIGDNTHETLSAVQQSESTLADAYATAKAGEQKVLVAAGLLIVGVVAVAALRRGI